MPQSPNVRRLIAHRMSLQMVPAKGGFGDALSALLEPGRLAREARAATEWVNEAISLVKAAPDNKFPNDDAIAGEILRRIGEAMTAK